MVTAELALTLPAIVFVLVVCLSALSWGVDQVQCVDAARVAVRELARGEAEGGALADARRSAPDGAQVQVSRSGDDVTVDVSAPPPAGLSFVAGETACSATARVEVTDDSS
ncbi:TadE family type IV pilus minor pilin [Janibacter corallicola]|uniref:TadE family type IV pilus minor pilin n=1 Tax=Janibacter corallicola TaxID=415212 RepID=UPI000835D751|nr:TadE family type IV pilus minor pilin [Janibacter corallicola]